MSSLSDRLDKDVEGWRPEAGDQVIGTVVHAGTREGDYGEYPYIEIETDNGDIVGVHAFHTVLKNELANVSPKVGDTLGIKYKGKQPTKRLDAKGKPSMFENYRVVHESATAEAPPAPDWAGMKQDAETEVSEQGIADAFGATEEDPF